MHIRRVNIRQKIGVMAALGTTLQSFGTTKQLLLACTQGTDDLSLFLFAASAIGSGLWAAWAFTDPDGIQSIIAWPNTLICLLSSAVCLAILVGMHNSIPGGAIPMSSIMLTDGK